MSQSLSSQNARSVSNYLTTDNTLHASHTVWKNRATFEAWTRSEAFRAAHRKAGDNKPLYLGHPQFEGFEAIQTVRGGKGAVA
jgi:heme-degrading monooxygenase HmoA